MKLFLKCDETAHVCDKSQYNEATRFENFKLKIHIVLCKCCRSYCTNNYKLTQSIRSANIETLPLNKKELLKSKLDNEMQAMQ